MASPALAVVVLLAVLTATALPSTARSTARTLTPVPSFRCAAELDEMSVCRPFVSASASSADAAMTPTDACCKAFSTAAIEGAGVPATSCLCSLFRNTYALGFLANATRVASLFSSCRSATATDASSFLESCRRGSMASMPHSPASHSDFSAPSPAPAPVSGSNGTHTGDALAPEATPVPPSEIETMAEFYRALPPQPTVPMQMPVEWPCLPSAGWALDCRGGVQMMAGALLFCVLCALPPCMIEGRE